MPYLQILKSASRETQTERQTQNKSTLYNPANSVTEGSTHSPKHANVGLDVCSRDINSTPNVATEQPASIIPLRGVQTSTNDGASPMPKFVKGRKEHKPVINV